MRIRRNRIPGGIPIQGARFGSRAIRQVSTRQTTLRIFNACAGISSYQSWTRVIAYRDVSIASGNNVQGAGAVGVGVQGPGLGRFKLVALVMLGGPTVVLRYRRYGSAACGSCCLQSIRDLHFDGHRDVEYNRILFVREIAERALLPNTSTGMSVHEANTAQSWVRVFSNREGTRATWKLSVDIGVLGPMFAPVTATPEFGGGTTHTAVWSG
ncbi:hypothetical protein E4U36_002412 [Claviceps purpurea]|nr:hypothetical protein E4U36_002412 [Claviceps purpurea]